MKTQKEMTKLAYTTPQIEEVLLDNEISLSLLSDPPYGPGETLPTGAAPEYLKNDPFKTDMA